MLASSKKKLKAFFPQSQTSPNHLQVLTDKDEPYIPSSNNIKTFLRLCPTDEPYLLYQIIEDSTKLKVTYQSEDSTSTKNKIKSNSKINTSSKRNQHIQEYKFTKIFDSSSTNNDIFNEVTLPLIEDLLIRNKSSLLFTYGISGSGKTFTINGNESSPGLLPLAITLIFIKLLDMENPPNLSCSYIEIYNECVYDLFSSTKNKLQIKEKHKTFYLDNCTNIEVTSIDEFDTILNEAGLRRKINKTLLNDSSSRSHTIFKIMLSTGASMSIVDLAGAERSKRADTRGIEFQETCNINTSLMTLGRCIDAMETNSKYIQPEKKIPVPIRESKLTKLFQEYFTGEQNVIMISTVKMSNDKNDIQENKNVLAFACKAKRVTPIRSWICNTNRKMKMLIASESKQKENKESQSDISSDGDNEINNELQSKYQQLIADYEKHEDDIDNLQEDNDILIEKLKLLEKEYATREYNTIVSKGRNFINETYKALTAMDVNQYYEDNSPEFFIIKNPLYKKYQEDEVNVLTKENSFTVAAQERKAFKAIAESFTIESTNATALRESEMNYQEIPKKKKKKTKKKERNNDDTTIQEIDEDNESTVKKKKRTKSKPKKSKKTVNEDSEDEEISRKKKYNSDREDDEEFENQKRKKRTKKKTKKSKKNISYIEEESNNDSSLIDMSPEKLNYQKKRKKEKVESDYSDELSSSNDNNDSDDSIHISAIKRSYAEALKNKRKTKKKTKGKKGTKSKK